MFFPETLSPKNHGQVSFDKRGYLDAVLVSFTATPPEINTPTFSSKRKGFAIKLRSSFVVTYRKISDVGMKLRSLKDKDYCSFCSSTKCGKGLSKINNSVKSFLQRWIISHPHVIQYTIASS